MSCMLYLISSVKKAKSLHSLMGIPQLFLACVTILTLLKVGFVCVCVCVNLMHYIY